MNSSQTRNLLVADPNSLRREMILQACASNRALRGHGASTIAELYRQTEALMPAYIALAAEFAQMREFTALASLFDMIGAELVIHGETPMNCLSYRCFRVIGPNDAASLVDALAPDNAAATASPRVAPRSDPPPEPFTEVMPRHDPAKAPEIIAIGGSTGGIVAIEKILLEFPEDCPPTLVVQHIRPGFADGLVRRLDRIVAPRVVGAIDGGALQRGHVYVATDSERHLALISRAGLRARLLDAPEVSGHRPSIDVLFDSLAQLRGRHRIAACLLTGMGADGADGMANLRAKEAFTIAQDKETSVIWGMPQAAIQRGGASVVLPLDRIGPSLLAGRAALSRVEGSVK